MAEFWSFDRHGLVESRHRARRGRVGLPRSTRPRKARSNTIPRNALALLAILDLSSKELPPDAPRPDLFQNTSRAVFPKRAVGFQSDEFEAPFRPAPHLNGGGHFDGRCR